jgi:glycosyltransferase involved in cell wall biosynthesis
MNVMFVTRRYWPAVGGIESYLRHVAFALAQRHRVVVVAERIDNAPVRRIEQSLRPPPSFRPFDDGEVRVEPLRLSPARRALMAPLAAQVAPGLRRYAHHRSRHAATALYTRAVAPVLTRLASEADLVHMWGGDMIGAAALRAARTLGIPYVTTPFAHEGHWGDDPASARTYRQADRVLALLEADAALYRRLGVDTRRIEVVGVATPGEPPGGGAELRRRRSIHGPLVLFLAARRPYKGFDLLLEAAPRVTARHPGVTFAFVGPGGPVAGPSILDAGEVDDRERADWLEAADVLCLPSESEILPSSFLEAWSLGTPVVASDIPPLAELVAASGGGVAVPRDTAALSDALNELLADHARLAVMGEAGRSYVRRQYGRDVVAGQIERVYWAVGAQAASAGRDEEPRRDLVEASP